MENIEIVLYNILHEIRILNDNLFLAEMNRMGLDSDEIYRQYLRDILKIKSEGEDGKDRVR